MRSLLGLAAVAILLASCSTSATDEATARSSPSPAVRPSATSAAAGSVSVTWSPDPLEQGAAEWRAAYQRASGEARRGNPGADAFLIGSWWALIDWCNDGGMPCDEKAASYIEETLGMDPRDVDACDWQGGGLGGTLADAYALTSTVLRSEEVQAPHVQDLMEGRGPWSQFQETCSETPEP